MDQASHQLPLTGSLLPAASPHDACTSFTRLLMPLMAPLLLLPAPWLSFCMHSSRQLPGWHECSNCTFNKHRAGSQIDRCVRLFLPKLLDVALKVCWACCEFVVVTPTTGAAAVAWLLFKSCQKGHVLY